MPIEIGLWKMGGQLEPVRFQPLPAEGGTQIAANVLLKLDHPSPSLSVDRFPELPIF